MGLVFASVRPVDVHFVSLHQLETALQFPRVGCEELLGQMFNLGVESHEDLNDALVYLLQGLVSQGLELPRIHWIET